MEESLSEIFNSKIYQKYPKLYATAEVNNLSFDEIEKMIQQIKEDRSWCKQLYRSDTSIEIGLKAILVRFNDRYPELDFKVALKNMKPLQYNYYGIQELKIISGERNLTLLFALIKE